MKSERPKTNINGSWFRQVLNQKRISQANLARHLGLHPSAMTLMFNGFRRMQLVEAEKIAEFLRQPLDEVLRQAGLPIGQAVYRRIPVIGAVDEQGRVTVEGETPAFTATLATGPVPEGTVAVRRKGRIYDGETLFFMPQDTVDPDAILRLSIVQVWGGDRLLARITRGTEPGRYDLILETEGHERLPDAVVQSATPVLWIRP